MKSILQDEDEKECFICGIIDDTLSEHHFIEGATNGNRTNSENYGLKAWICYKCHSDIHLHPKKIFMVKTVSSAEIRRNVWRQTGFYKNIWKELSLKSKIKHKENKK